LERKPTPEEIVGKWEVAWVAPSVKEWLANNDIHQLPPKAGIEFHADGTFTATSLPYTLDHSMDKCRVINRNGRWKLIDSTADDDLVKWGIQVMPADVNVVCLFDFHEDSQGIYLDNPVDWENQNSVVMRRGKKPN
jgi:hypothetical protein